MSNTKPPKPITPTNGPKPFHGIYNFGTNGSALASNPSVAGTYLGYAWSQFEPQQGKFNWTQLDADMLPWSKNNKKCIIRVSASGWSKWGAHPNKSWTPSWVYAGTGQDAVKSVTEDDGAIKPQYWAPAFQQYFSDFVAAFATRYNGHPNIVCVEMGIGDGGETKPDTRNNPNRLKMWQGIGYTDALWWETIQQMITTYQAVFKTTPLALMPDNTFLGSGSGLDEHTIVNYAITQKPAIWLQNNGVIAGQKPDTNWLKTTILAEQRLKTAQSGDSLAQDLQLMMNYGASYALCFEVDLLNPANQDAMRQVAALAH